MATYGWGSKFVKELKRVGLVPDKCCRIVIDIPHDDIIKIYYETNADKTKLDKIILDDIMAEEIMSINRSGEPKQQVRPTPPDPMDIDDDTG